MTDVTVEPTSQIEVNSPCIHCGYNLRGLLSTGICPECGQAIAASLQGDLLRFAEPAWLKRVVFGVWLMLLSFIGLLFVVLVAMALPWAWGWWVGTVAVVASPLLTIWATFCITAQEPRLSLSEDPVLLRRLVRVCAVVSATRQIIDNVGTISLPKTTLQVIDIAGAFAAVVMMFGLLVYLRRFGRRIPGKKLAGSASTLLWVLPTSMLLGFVLSWTVGAAPAFPPVGTASGIEEFLVLITNLCFGIGFIYYLIVLFGFNRALSEALAIASGEDSEDSESV
jgi:hypothetical protein